MSHLLTVPLPPDAARPELVTEDGRVVQAVTPALAPPVAHGSLADIPFVNAREAPAAVAFSRKHRDGTWRDVSCAEFAAEVRSLSKGLIALGLRPGDRLAIMSRTRYEWTLLDFAAWAAGLITVPVYPASSPGQVGMILQDAGVRACAVEGVEEARLLTALRPDLPELEHLWQLTAFAGGEGGTLGHISAAGRELPDEAVAERRGMLDPGRAATLIYTSGTSGAPKGCVLTHGNFLAEVDNTIELLHPVFRQISDKAASTLLFLPLAHVLGRMTAVACVRARVRLGHSPSGVPEELREDLGGFRPTFLVAIPHILEKVFNTGRATAESLGRAASFDRAEKTARRFGRAVARQLAEGGEGPGWGLRTARAFYDTLVYRRLRDALGGHVRYVLCGGSPLGERLSAFYAGAGVAVLEGYGLTESTGAATLTPLTAPCFGTVGRPLPGTAVRIAADGEIMLRGAQIFAGYWDSGRHEVVSVTDAGGWLATGDVGELDARGYLTLTGRKKDLIITSGGKNVAPAPLEDWLRAHPLVSQCLVIGDNRPYLVALITLDADGLGHWRRITGHRTEPVEQLIRETDLLRHLRRAVDDANRLVSTSESIRGFRVLPQDFTAGSRHLTPSLKLRRAAIMEDYAAEVEELYSGC